MHTLLLARSRRTALPSATCKDRRRSGCRGRSRFDQGRWRSRYCRRTTCQRRVDHSRLCWTDHSGPGGGDTITRSGDRDLARTRHRCTAQCMVPLASVASDTGSSRSRHRSGGPMTASPPRGHSLAELQETRRADVLVAVRAVEEAEQPVPRTALRALADATLRASVERVLFDSGRVLIETPRGFLSGYADDVREALTVDGIGILPAEDRAVLCLVLLHAIAIPRRAAPSPGRPTGQWPSRWTHGRSASPNCPTL